MGIFGSKQVSKPVHVLRHGVASSIGHRRYMEDEYSICGGLPCGQCRGFFVVCDGHGGSDAAKFASKNLLRYSLLDRNLKTDFPAALGSSFLRADVEFKKEVASGRLKPSGTTALAAAVLDRHVVIGNVGDCRAILSRGGRAVELTNDHKPSSPTERQRIEAAGGFVDVDGYVNGELSVSRAIGDFHIPNLKLDSGMGPLIAEPEVTEVDIGEAEEFLVLTSDGIWMRSQTVVNLVRDSLRENNCPEKAAEAVLKSAMKCDNQDNITVVVICFKADPPAKRQLYSNSRLRINRESSSFAQLVKAVEGVA